MTTTTKCAHPPCECKVDPNGEFGRFCSEHCKASGEITALACHCQHPGCSANAH